ncbi:MAG: dimethyl sulfoxide reductase anchor subunit [Candidatus Omnitrophica bacterium]|nr:dimethyl sulfoxide reductase anchor subunit [Candidatus Omnitrophota bacterium]
MNSPTDRRALTAAIERFSRKHDKGVFGPNQKKYEELIPKTAPGPGKQYAFEVDLDKCTGCKACVTACHSENGLDEDETWRGVGLIQGGTDDNAVLQHVTTACHHCADPACLSGCPTLAYTKDEETGVVKHLDDQCFGCQYCILKCPYDVPKYNEKRGIVHKCDMCVGRLKAGQAPACVRACPNGAIRITVVDTAEVRQNSREFVDVPGAPMSDYTYPTTKFKTARRMPADARPADDAAVKPEHSHLPLVVMLTLTQLSVGTFLYEWIATTFFGAAVIRPVLVTTALAVGLAALGASILHLGRPQLFYRAVLGFRQSWLSREIIAFAAFAHVALLYAACVHLPALNQWLSGMIPGNDVLPVLSVAVVLLGMTGILASVMVYRDTRRPFWDHPLTNIKFFATMGMLGSATGLLVAVAGGHAVPGAVRGLAVLISAVTVIKVVSEAAVFWLKDYANRPMIAKTAVLLRGPLHKYWRARWVCGLTGGIVLPLGLASAAGSSPMATGMLAAAILLFCVAGELASRYLFFRAVVAYRMPGGS